LNGLRSIAFFCVFALALQSKAPVHAQGVSDPTQPQPPGGPPKPANEPPSPFTFTLVYTADLLDNVVGGRTTGPGYVHLIKVSAAYDGGMVGRDGLTGLISVVHVSGSDFSAMKVGAVQPVSSLEAEPQALRVYEIWLQRAVFAGQGGVKGGLVDLNTTFDVQETAALFLNASQGIGAEIGDTGRNGPSNYPTPAPAMTMFYRPAEGWTAQLGLFDGVAGDPAHKGAAFAVKFEGALVIGQIERRLGDAARFEGGAWLYTGGFPALEPSRDGRQTRVSGDAGVYALLEGQLAKKPEDEQGGLSGWIRAGLANGDINIVQNYLGTGLVYTGPFQGRDQDEVGVAIARAGFGRGARAAGAADGREIDGAETDVEASYRYAFADWLNIQPDMQIVFRPHGDTRIRNALIAGLRLTFTGTR
jgi:porin